jgi:hypothetical protein
MKEINKLNNDFYKDLISPFYEVVFYIERNLEKETSILLTNNIFTIDIDL